MGEEAIQGLVSKPNQTEDQPYPLLDLRSHFCKDVS